MKHGKGKWSKDEANPNGNRYTGAAQTPQRVIVNAGRVFCNMYWRVHVGTPVHDPFPLNLVKPILGVKFIDRDIDTRG